MGFPAKQVVLVVTRGASVEVFADVDAVKESYGIDTTHGARILGSTDSSVWSFDLPMNRGGLWTVTRQAVQESQAGAMKRMGVSDE